MAHPKPNAKDRHTPIDFRMALVGAMLPDIIDKPLAFWILPNVLESSRTIGHTTVFAAAMFLIAAFVLSRGGRPGLALLVLAIASAGHLVMDGMWESPQTLWWPFLGWDFPGSGAELSLGNWLEALRDRPAIYIPESVGAIAFGTLAVVLSRRRTWTAFLGRGRVE